ncbi:MAG: YjgN family protein [Paracoccus sp. (in: a-proteobacteria)]|uniref:YjgN family protein n=1 Tax=Paracoccus sp. TaxID=267 RepID=UPI0026DF2474|nr:YjgN family protein [Paracoccus sp. (in: a-proteobacteria)]MDO5632794.1 YjgN family protein [Paracoccus sp. (in: a-proteobacteria)]
MRVNPLDQKQTLQVQFTGSAKTYFGIWIVNILLSIVTLGIYSAWAKVRRRRYFAQHTVIDGRRFDYHATGQQILIGRIIVVIGLILMAIPILNIFVALALLIALPWLLNRALAFNARMTSFSGVRFGFEGSYGRAFLVFMLYPLLSMLTLYTTWPFVARAVHRYTIGNSRYGTARFAFDSPIWPFYRAFLMAAGWAIIALVVGFVVVGGPALISDFIFLSQYGLGPDEGMIIHMMLMYVVLFVAVLPAAFVYQAFLRNAVYANTTLAGEHRFVSNIAPMRLMWIALSNAIVVVCTLGLMLPWAHVRMSRYLADSTQVIVVGSLDQFIGTETGKMSALGDAYTDIEGVDLGIAI